MIESLAVYYLSALIVVGGVLFGFRYVELPYSESRLTLNLLDCVSRWDGLRYAEIVEDGYYYDPARRSNVVSFPLFPLVGKTIVEITGVETRVALLFASHGLLIGCFVLLGAYVRTGESTGQAIRGHALLVFGLWPTTFFFRMTYSESTFLLCTLLVFYAMRRRYPIILIALLAGLATAARPVGVALLLPFADYVWQRSDRLWLFARRMVYLAPLACWGLIAFMAYQYVKFNEPLGFAKSQVHWHLRPPVSGLEKAEALVTLEPIWSVYVPSSPAYWQKIGPAEDAVFSLQFANPFFFLFATFTIGLGAWRHWLSRAEILLAVGLLLIPYITRAHEMCMASQGRFVAAIFPVYIVLGHILSRMPASISGALYGVLAFFLAVYAALFAAGYLLI